jgi:hypothetical protein
MMPPLKVVVAHDPAGLARWQMTCLDRLLDAGEVSVVGTIINPSPPAPNTHGLWQRLYNRAVTYGLDSLDLVTPPAGLLAAYVPDRRHSTHPGEPDFLLDFSSRGVVSRVPWPPLGIWRVHIGDAAEGELVTSREVAGQAHSITISVVAAAGAGDAGHVLHYATIKTRRSHRATLQAVLNEATATCLGACRRARIRSQGPVPPPLKPDLPVCGPLQVLKGQFIRSIRRATDILCFRDVWAMGLIRRPVAELLRSDTLPMPSWHQIPCDGEFHADPFPIRIGDAACVLFERYDPSQHRGLIACARLSDWDATPGNAVMPAIDLGCHMSYPAVFTYAGHTYCAPEAHVLGGLRIFRLDDAETHWTPVAHVLPDIALIDATLFEHHGSWWLLATVSGTASDTDLHAWHAASPFGPWTPHRLNPVKSDVRSSRPAGNLFLHDNQLFRPAQDCERGYGMAVVINRIVHIDTDQFLEVALKRFEPGAAWPFPDGMHTFNVAGDIVLIDAKRRVSKAPRRHSRR